MPHLFSRRAWGAGLLAPLGRMWAQSCAPPPGGPATPFQPPAGLTNIQRKAISALNGTEVVRLRLAYQKLRELAAANPQDPRGWMQQAQVHCFQCGGNPQQSDIHQSWLFLPWHRAYLYFHERILAKLLGDDTFRLPYWDWDAAISRNLPLIHRPPTVNGASNPLFDAKRGVNNGSAMPADIFPPDRNPMNAPTFRTFGGNASAGGALENGPHGLIHVWTGDPTMSDGLEDMGRLDTAARDPIFYAHHCNIDRLWAEWIRRDPARHRNPATASFLNTRFTFFDEESKLRSIRVRDVLDSTRLGSSYAPGAALSAPKPVKRFELTLDQGGNVRLTPALRTRLLGDASTGLNVRRSLVVEDAVMPERTGLYYLFAGAAPPAGSGASAAPNYLGYVGFLKGMHPRVRKSSVMLQASRVFAEAAGAAQGVTLTLVPAGATGAAAEGTRLAFSGVHVLEE